MTTATETKPISSDLPGLSARAILGGRMYALAFDMDIETLRGTYGEPYNGAYGEIRRVLKRHGFSWQQGERVFWG